MAADALRDELLAVEGVADAEVDDASGAPSGVRVRLTPEADADKVGEEVQRILSTHGMRSRVDAGEEEPAPSGPPPPPGAPGEVVSLAGAAARSDRATPDAATIETPSVHVLTSTSLAAVSVEETRDGMLVTVTVLDGRRASRRARWTGGGLDEAVVAAVAEVYGAETLPLLVGVENRELGDSSVVTVLLETGEGRRSAGAAVVEAGRPFAIARAAWAALDAAG